MFPGILEVLDANDTSGETLGCLDTGIEVGDVILILRAILILIFSSLEVLPPKPPSSRATARSSPRFHPI